MKVLLSFVCVALICVAYLCPAEPGPVKIAGANFEWSKRPQLSDRQQELLHVYTSLETPEIKPEIQKDLQAKLAKLKEELGTNTVRHARADELIEKPTGWMNEVSIYNPSPDNVAFTVSVRGDEQRVGTRVGSIGRLTFLPPHGTLVVTNLHWNTPRMKTPK